MTAFQQSDEGHTVRREMEPLALDEVTEGQLHEAAEANMVRHMGWAHERIPGMSVVADEGLTRIDSGLMTDTFNVVCRARLTDDSRDRRIAEVTDYFRSVGRPFSWWVGPADRPHDLGVALMRTGLMEAESEASMAADLRSLPPPESLPTGLGIERVRTEEQVRAFGMTLFGGNVSPDLPDLRFYEIAAPVLLSEECPLWFYLGYVNGEPVATCEMTLGGGVVGLYNVSTLESHRRRGIAGALVRHCSSDAEEQGYRTVVLQASEEGERVYARFGFRVTGRFTEYKPPA
jgi:ribosomal protein S18 acetylase RimI-like enzyme